jgi:mRNA-degrading endonuclease RelE of RelBE toxin-antitoxin system
MELIKHELHLDPKAKSIKQRLYRFAQDKKDVIKREIARLLDADFIKKCTTKIGLLIPFLYLKRIKIGGCVLIISILIRHTKRFFPASPDRSGCGLHSQM